MTRDEYLIRQHEFQPRGMQLAQSKLTEDQVRAAREEYERAQYSIRHIQQNYSIAGLARKYGVSPGAMEKALNYSTWRHVQ